MGSTKTTQIDGDVSIGRNIALGGNATLQGGALIKGDVKILGWLEAHNIKLPYKGLFTTPENLNETYPHPHDGWWAIVGDTVPGPIYVAWHGKWEDTGAIGGNIQEIIALEEAKEYADEKAAETLREANRHTDEREVEIRRDYAAADEETLRDAKTYADDKDAEKLAEAKRYTDEKTADALEKAKDYAEEKADDALRAAKAYHDEKERNLRAEMTEADKTLRNDMQATDEAIRGEFAAADAEITDAFETADQKIIADYMEADNETLEEAKRYADEKDGEKLQEAKDYANDMDGNTLLKAKEYAEAKVDELMESYEAADTEVLRAAQEYTDSKVTEVTRAYKEEIAAVDSDLDAEIARANGRETELGTAITAEETRATGVENGLRTDLTAETARAEKAEQDETVRAKAAEKANTDAIAAERTRATARENEIDAAYKAADTSTLNAAKSYTDTKVAELVDSAPETLNTLEELAQALGDDPNFATTIAGQIGEKANKTELSEGLAKKAEKTHTHAVSQITDRKALTITLNGASAEGTSKVTYDASTAKSLNITPAGIGAAATGHKHTKSEITDFPTIPTVPGSLKNPYPLKAGQKSYDGSVGVTITAADIGAAAASHTHSDYVTLGTEQTVTGSKTFGKQIVSTVAQGTPPLKVTSNTVVSNLNADLLDGLQWSNFNLERLYTVDAKALSTDKFYPILFSPHSNRIVVDIGSTTGTGSLPYNFNGLRAIINCGGWSDRGNGILVLDRFNFSNNEITIGSIGLGTTNGWTAIWVRGGLTYNIRSNVEPQLQRTDYTTTNGEKYTVGPNLDGGSENDKVVLYWKNTDAERNKNVVLKQLPKATTSVLGGVKIGANISVADDGTISTHAPVTSLAWSAITGKPTIPSAYTLPKATDKALGGIMIGYAANGKNYPVVLDSSGKAYVNVPWTDTDTKYTHPTNHPATMITPDATHRFVTDTEKSTWNGKASTAVATQTVNGLMSSTDKKNLDSVMSQIGDIATILDNINGE